MRTPGSIARRAFLNAVLALVLTAGRAHADETRVVLLHTTDLHGALTGFDYLADRPAARGLTRLATMIAAVRRESLATVLLDAGDAIHDAFAGIRFKDGLPVDNLGEALARSQHDDIRGTLPQLMIAAMNRLGYDAMAVGNHEFSYGRGALDSARTASRFPWLAANVVRTSDGKPAFGTSIVKTVGSVRVGIVGLSTPATPAFEDSAHVAGLRFESPVEAARREVARLREQEHCDVIVLVAHTGLERDPATGAERQGDTPNEHWGNRLATEVDSVDVLILGHSHVVIPSLQLGNTLVTQAGKWGENLGRVDLTLSRAGPTERWRVASRRARILAVADTTAEDASLTALAAPYHEATREALDRPVGREGRDLESPGGRFADGAVWDLIHRVQLEASGADVSLAALPDPFARIPSGNVTMRDVMRLYPYDNTLAVVELTGAELRQTLEQSATYLAPYTFASDQPLANAGMPAYNFDSAEGVTYAIDLTRPAGDRIRGLALRGEPMAPERRVKVVVNSYRANGGGGFVALRKAPRTWSTTRTVPELIAQAFVNDDPIAAAPATRNWTLTPDYVSTPERPHIDRLVRLGVIEADEVMRLGAESIARRGDLVYWLSRAFGWRERRTSGAFSDVPDSLAPWLDGLLKRHVLGSRAEMDRFEPFEPALTPLALDWAERAARAAGYAVSKGFDRDFRLGLVTGLGLGAHGDTLTRGQTLGLIANLRLPVVRILETTDFHGAILPTGRESRTRRAIGGSAVLAAHIERLRSQNPAGTVLIDGGDCFQGTMISNLQFGRPVVEQMNALRYSAMAIGNHEFDWSADTLERRVHGMHFAALGANMRERKTGKLPRWVRADTVVTRRGVKIGVLGMCYSNTPSVTLARHVRRFEFLDDSATAARRVPGLRARASVVIGVGHIPAESDSAHHARGGDLPRLARGVHGVDAWFGGHSHNQVLDKIDGVPVMIAGSHGQVVGVCDLVVDPITKRVRESNARLVTTYADEVTPDSTWLARIERWNAAVAPISSIPVGKNARTLTRFRGGESALGNLVADAIRAAATSDIAMQNSGGLRADLPEGAITRGTVYEVMPFDNRIFTLELSGADVRRAIEQALRSERVTQVSGLRYTFDLSKPEMQRVVAITDSIGTPLDDAKTYKIATNDFMATGGDNYDALAGGKNRVDTGLLVRDALEDLIEAKTKDGASLDVRTDGRIERVGAQRPRDSR